MPVVLQCHLAEANQDNITCSRMGTFFKSYKPEKSLGQGFPTHGLWTGTRPFASGRKEYLYNVIGYYGGKYLELCTVCAALPPSSLMTAPSLLITNFNSVTEN